jgi:site-specific recombinase XerD
MLGAGCSLAEIGQVLHHGQLRTTVIYAKVDYAALRTLALPWPQGGVA